MWPDVGMAETRNYVQRVMENLQVYAARLGASVATVEPNLHRVTTIERRAKPNQHLWMPFQTDNHSVEMSFNAGAATVSGWFAASPVIPRFKTSRCGRSMPF
jgi:hypothetical protein